MILFFSYLYDHSNQKLFYTTYCKKYQKYFFAHLLVQNLTKIVQKILWFGSRIGCDDAMIPSLIVGVFSFSNQSKIRNCFVQNGKDSLYTCTILHKVKCRYSSWNCVSIDSVYWLFVWFVCHLLRVQQPVLQRTVLHEFQAPKLFSIRNSCQTVRCYANYRIHPGMLYTKSQNTD